MWDECNCAVIWAFFGIAFLWDGMKIDLFQSCGHCWVFQMCWHIEYSTFTALSFRILNSSTGILSPPLALSVVMLLRPTWLHIPGCLALVEWSHHRDYLGREDLFCIVLLCILATSSFFKIIYLFYFTILHWFWHTLTWIRHRCTWVPKHEPPSPLPPCIIPLDHPRAPAPSILHPALNIDWRFVSYMIVYMFQCHSPKSSHPLPLPLSPKDCSIHLCLFCTTYVRNDSIWGNQNWKRHVYPNVHCSTVYNSQDMETT